MSQMDLKQARIQARMYKNGPFSVQVPDVAAVPGETIPRRHPDCVNELVTALPGNVTTTYELLKNSAERFGDEKALGSRRLLKLHQETKKVKKMVDGEEREVDKNWTYFELSGYEYLTFREYLQLALTIGSGLRNLGMVAGDRLHIFAATSPNWLAIAHGACVQNMPIVTAYDTLGAQGLQHSMVATSAKAIFLDSHLLPTLIPVLVHATAIKFVIWNSQMEVNPEHVRMLKEAHPHLEIMSLDEVRKRGEANLVDAVPPTPDDLCCIMYTSGSTGTPKGVPLKHRNVIAAVAGVSVVVEKYLGPGDGLLTYLPLAHILEFVFEHASLYWGSCMGYGNPKTLSDASVKNCNGDIREFQPTVLVGVPAVWETVKKGIISKITEGSILVQKLFWGALWAKETVLALGLPGADLLDAIVFKKIQAATGGRLRICLNGGGPISKETQKFISLAICPMISGYGLTETAAMGALQDPMEWTVQSIGAMPGAIEIKLVDYADAGYYVTNKPNPQGEVWIRGNSVMDGYYQNDKETQESITPDGWFKTGDIGEFDHDGHLKLIDRKKNLIKTLNGEYIALEKLESVYRSSPVVSNICVYADDRQAKPVAIIVPAEPVLRKIATSVGVESQELADLVTNKKVQASILKQLQSVGRTGGLSGIEIIDGVVVSDAEWTPQNNLVTAAQKLNRKNIVNQYKKEIDTAYGSA